MTVLKYIQLVIDIALKELNYLEKASNAYLDDKTRNAGSANYTKYGRDMHNLYPSVMDFPAAWCDAFVDWCFYQAYGISNAKSLLGGNFDDYTVASAQLYKNKGAWYTSNPKVGDQIFFKNSSRICHTGLVVRVTSTKVVTIEGNSSSASGVVSNGGAVVMKEYSLSYSRIAGYGRPAYEKFCKENKVNSSTSTSTSASSTVLKMGSKGSDVKELQNNLNKLGYNCGEADGDFGIKTYNAVKNFQKDNKELVVDGEVGSATKAKIKECLSRLNKPTSTTTNTNTKDSNVLKGQKWLNDNYSDVIKKATGKILEIDGCYGNHSRWAALAVWKDLMNRKYDATFTVSNQNFGDSCKIFAKNATIKQGVSGTFTYLCQFILSAKGFYKESINGKCEASTVLAIKEFQKATKLTADGKCGKDTWFKLFN